MLLSADLLSRSSGLKSWGLSRSWPTCFLGMTLQFERWKKLGFTEDGIFVLSE